MTRVKMGTGTDVGVGPRIKTWKKALEIGKKELLLLVRALKGAPASSLSIRLISGGLWQGLY